jgi:hypothetical protein
LGQVLGRHGKAARGGQCGECEKQLSRAREPEIGGGEERRKMKAQVRAEGEVGGECERGRRLTDEEEGDPGRGAAPLLRLLLKQRPREAKEASAKGKTTTTTKTDRAGDEAGDCGVNRAGNRAKDRVSKPLRSRPSLEYHG